MRTTPRERQRHADRPTAAGDLLAAFVVVFANAARSVRVRGPEAKLERLERLSLRQLAAKARREADALRREADAAAARVAALERRRAARRAELERLEADAARHARLAVFCRRQAERASASLRTRTRVPSGLRRAHASGRARSRRRSSASSPSRGDPSPSASDAPELAAGRRA